jgi:membrane protease YdiL (CAAX protease family)
MNMTPEFDPNDLNTEHAGLTPVAPITPAIETSVQIVRKPRVWTVFVVFVLSLVLYVVVVGICFVAVMVMTADHSVTDPKDFGSVVQNPLNHPRALLASAFGAAMVVIFMAVAATACSPVPWKARINFRRPQLSAVRWLVALVGAIAFGIVLNGLAGLKLLPESVALEAIEKAVTSANGVWLLIVFFVIGLLPGFSEELLFRGYFQTRLVERWGAAVGILVTAVIFGLFHLDLVQGLYAAAIGVYLGCLTVWSRSIIPAMICHSFNNTNTLFVVLATYAPWLETPQSVPVGFALIAVGLTLIGISLWYLRSRATQPGLSNLEIAAV